MTEKKESVFKFLMASGLLGFVASMMVLAFEIHEQRRLEDKAFQNELIQSVIELEDHDARRDRFDLYATMGLWDDDYLPKDSVLYLLGRDKGRQDVRHMRAIMNSIMAFQKQHNRLPKNFGELLSQFKVKGSLDYFDGNVQYNQLGPSSFEIITGGADGILFFGKDQKEKTGKEE